MGFPRLAEHPRIPQQGNKMLELAVVISLLLSLALFFGTSEVK